MTSGQLIQAARKAAGLTQEELGGKLGISGSALAQYETGKRNPKLETLQRVAAALGISYYDLLPTESVEVIPGRLKIVRSSPAESKFLTYNIEATDEEAFNIGLQIFDRADIRIAEHTPLALISDALTKLNPEGQAKAVERVEELTEIPKYRRDTEPPPEAPDGPPEAK